MSVPKRPSVYDNLRPQLDAEDLIRRLGIVETSRQGSESYCNPLCHESSSKQALQINLHTGRWNCKACQGNGVNGDLIQLVEYVMTGGAVPTKGDAQWKSETHRQALEWLCLEYGVPFDSENAGGDPALDVVHMFAMQAHEHLLKRPDVLEWIQEKWGFSRDVVEGYGLGFISSPLMPSINQEAAHPGSRGAFRASGLGWYPPTGPWKTHFEGRITFPYLEHGRAVYLIGRSTPWTPKKEDGTLGPKYHKLSVHSENRPYISEAITNDHLYNEPVMATVDSVVIAEGVADAVALSALGVPLVSPVTVSFNSVDLARFVERARKTGLRRAEILFDNELSGTGNWASRRLGLQLVENGIAASILTLPLGPVQQAALEEVRDLLGRELFEDMQKLGPSDRKKMILEAFPDDTKRAWVIQQIEATKIDAAEWVAMVGAGAPGKFDLIRKSGVDVLEIEIQDRADSIEIELSPSDRAMHFGEVIDLVASIDDSLLRAHYAGRIAQAAGKGVPKSEIQKRIAGRRRAIVTPKRKKESEASESKETLEEIKRDMQLLPPEPIFNAPEAPPAPTVANDPDPSRPEAPDAPAAPGKPGSTKNQTSHERYAPARDSVARSVAAKLSEEHVGQYVAQTITKAMGFTVFRTSDEMYVVRGNDRIAVGLGNPLPRFSDLLWMASGLTAKKAGHRSYIASVVYFLGLDSQRVEDVSWSFVDPQGKVYFPCGDRAGSLLLIQPGSVSQIRMADCRVPAVSGPDFQAIKYTTENGGIDLVQRAMRWVSISEPDRLLLTYWITCLPILRRIGTVPIVRVEGGSGSGKTRAIDAVSYLVNGRRTGAVPTAAALVSRMSTEMLTVDDNREACDVSQAFLGTLLQATHLGAREKRKTNSDTGTVVERITGALLMNGVEPIHDGRPELASRMLILRAETEHIVPGSPRANGPLLDALSGHRGAFWSEAARRCAGALDLDREHGEALGLQIEKLFGVTRIGRLSAYLRIMYLAWVSGEPSEDQAVHLETVAECWAQAFTRSGEVSLQSLLAEELVVTSVRYVIAHGVSVGVQASKGSTEFSAFGGKLQYDVERGDVFLGPVRARHLSRLIREAGKAMNGPEALTRTLKAGQLEARVMDGLDFLAADGIEVIIDKTPGGVPRFTFRGQLHSKAYQLPGEGLPPEGF